MQTHFIPTVRKETEKSHSGFNYVKIEISDNGSEFKAHYECNCSIFKTEQEAKEFIEVVFA